MYAVEVASDRSIDAYTRGSRPNCQGDKLYLPASNADAREVMRDFSWTNPSWSLRIKSMKCFKMNAAGQPIE